jgi:inner membrane protein
MEPNINATPTPLSLIDRFNAWLQESIMIKLISIGFLVLILLIPGAWIESLIFERQQRADEAINEVSSKWSASQTISGPVLVVPFVKRDIIDKGKDGVEITEHTEKAFFLPELLNINGTVAPETRHRGIFDVVVYTTDLGLKSEFKYPDFKALNINEKDVMWKDAYLAFGITDLRGISENPTFKAGDSSLTAEPSSNLGISTAKSTSDADYTDYTSSSYSNFSNSGIVARLGWTSKEDFRKDVTTNLSLKGSKSLSFVPAGKTTKVELSGNWKDPSFDGNFIPESHTITDEGFTANWNILHFNRPFAQQWVESGQHLSGSEFGVRLLVPVDQYQKSIRTAKYSALIILLTFIALFLVEITQKIRIHPFQYILIGAALTIYYTLLLSISEHLGYNNAYLVASGATVILVALYSTTFLNSSKLVVIFSILLVIFYAFIFVIIQEQDYALLIGSIGLFFIIAVLMYFSRKIRWYKTDDRQIFS